MPVEFIRETCTDYNGYVVCDSTKLIVAYDGSGRRISKTRLKKTAFDGPWYAEHVTHYTGIGTEVRENLAASEPVTQVVVNMPQGLGRYGIEDADHAAENGSVQIFEWFLKNHLGSTMLVYGTGAGTPGGLKAAYDYRSFGEQVTLTSPSTGKVTENFTGKERDDETQLDYFGARYLDPMLGMWISVDPMRQFVSPYLYAGNGMNPVNIIDLDGDWGLDINVGCKGAVIAGGLINLTVRYDSENPARNKVMLTIGYGVGLDLGLPIKKRPKLRARKAMKKAERFSGGPSGDAKDDETGRHSQIDVSIGIIPLQFSFKDGSTTPSSAGIGIGGAYYDTYTIDLGRFFSDKTESKQTEALEDQADFDNTDSDSKK